MLKITDDDAHNCLVLEPSGPLTRRDLDALTERFDARVNATDRVPNLVIRAGSFPAWADFAALLKHLRFIREHHRLVERVAIVSDARALDLAPRLARRFVSADVRHFPAADFEAALAWVGERAGRDQPRHGDGGPARRRARPLGRRRRHRPRLRRDHRAADRGEARGATRSSGCSTGSAPSSRPTRPARSGATRSSA